MERPKLIENNRCAIDGRPRIPGGFEGFLNGGSIIVQFKPGFFGPKNIYVRTTDNEGRTSDWEQQGTWTAGAEVPPQAISVSPYIGSGSRRRFTFSVMDQNGSSDIARVEVQVQKLKSAEDGCSFALKHSGTGPFSAQPVSNTGPCKISIVRVEPEGRDALRIRADFEFPDTMAGLGNIYAEVEDHEHQSSGRVWLGSWTIPGIQSPASPAN